MSSCGLFQNLDSWDPAPLRAQLRKGGFHRSGLMSLGMPEHWLRSAVPRAALLGHAPPGSPVDTLIRLFTLGDAVDGTRALTALGDAVHGLLEIGFLSAGGGVIRSRFQICPVSDGCDNMNLTAAEISSGDVPRPRSVSLACLSNSAWSMRADGSAGPGPMALTRMRGASACANVRVAVHNADFDMV